MRISLVNLNLVAGDAIGGGIIHQARFFHRRGDDVRVYVLHPPHQVPEEVEALTRVVTLKDLIDGSQEHFSLSDLYIYHYPNRHALMESIRGINRGTVIFHYHNVTPPELWGSNDSLDMLVQGMEGKALVHYADLCLADSPYNKQDLVDQVGYSADRIYVLPFAVPVDRFAPGPKDLELVRRYGLEGKQVLLFVGRMAGNKRIDLLVEALAQVKTRVPNAVLLLVGDHSGAPAYREISGAARALAAKLDVAGDVIWTGPQYPQDPFLRLADVYVTASLHEGFGLPLIEAMACGVPVVASRAGAMPWVVGDAGLLAEPADAASLADQVVRVLQEPELKATLLQRGLKRAADFSLERYEAGLARIVDQAVTYTLPPMLDSEAESGGGGAQAATPARQAGPEQEQPAARPADRAGMMMEVLADELEIASDVSFRGYVVHSDLPLIGPLVAWLRRNATSHLREPYLDPMIDRQVAFNRRLVEWIKRARGTMTGAERRQAEIEARVQALEAQVEALTRRLRD